MFYLETKHLPRGAIPLGKWRFPTSLELSAIFVALNKFNKGKTFNVFVFRKFRVEIQWIHLVSKSHKVKITHVLLEQNILKGRRVGRVVQCATNKYSLNLTWSSLGIFCDYLASPLYDQKNSKARKKKARQYLGDNKQWMKTVEDTKKRTKRRVYKSIQLGHEVVLNLNVKTPRYSNLVNQNAK